MQLKFSTEKLLTSPILGKPTPDTHPLRDDDAESDHVMETQYIPSPPVPAGKPLPVSNGIINSNVHQFLYTVSVMHISILYPLMHIVNTLLLPYPLMHIVNTLLLPSHNHISLLLLQYPHLLTPRVLSSVYPYIKNELSVQ